MYLSYLTYWVQLQLKWRHPSYKHIEHNPFHTPPNTDPIYRARYSNESSSASPSRGPGFLSASPLHPIPQWDDCYSRISQLFKNLYFPAVTLKVPYVDLASLVSGGLQLKRDVVRGVGNIASSAVRAKLAYAGAVAGANAYSLRQHLISQRPADDIHMSF